MIDSSGIINLISDYKEVEVTFAAMLEEVVLSTLASGAAGERWRPC